MDKFKKNFGKMFKSNYQVVKSEEHVEDFDELRERIGNLENMFSKIMSSVDKISNDIAVIKKK